MYETPEIDFSAKTQAELEATLARINRLKYPANYEACEREINKRKSEGRWEGRPAAPSKDTERLERYQLFSRRRRILAALVDGLVLAAAGLLLYPITRLVEAMGFFASFPFLVLVLVYTAFLNSEFGGGQTIGKVLLHLRIRNERGGWLALPVAFAWAAYVASDNPFLEDASRFLPWWIAFPISAMLAMAGILNIIFIFLHPQKRTFLDLLTGSVVSDADMPFPAKVAGIEGIPKWRAFVAVVAVIVVGINFGIVLWTGVYRPVERFGELREEVASATGAHVLEVSDSNFLPLKQSATRTVVIDNWISAEKARDTLKLAATAQKIREIAAAPKYQWGDARVQIHFVGHSYLGVTPMKLNISDPDLEKK